MKAGTVQIAWHGSQPVLSVDFHLATGLLATAGADHDIKLWTLHPSEGLPRVAFEASLSSHTSVVNVIRFSPSGEAFASGADGGEILLWRQNKDSVLAWKVVKTLRFHPKDVLHLDWSPDGSQLASASVDNSCIVWDISKGSPLQVIADHLHYVQGVAWDPAGSYLATMSADRTCRIYSCRAQRGKNNDKKYTCQHVVMKANLADDAKVSKYHLLLDENMPSFFRRLSWSPDGSFLVLPAGVSKLNGASLPTAYAFSRTDFSRPAFALPGASKAVVAVRFCPAVFGYSEASADVGRNGIFKLPYRLVFAIATLDSVAIYDTQRLEPIAIIGAVHYAAITDLTWSLDARMLVISSQDGYCTVAEFADEELGPRMQVTELPEQLRPRFFKQPEPRLTSPDTHKSEEAMEVDEDLRQQQQAGEANRPITMVVDSVEVKEVTESASSRQSRRITPVLIESGEMPNGTDV